MPPGLVAGNVEPPANNSSALEGLIQQVSLNTALLRSLLPMLEPQRLSNVPAAQKLASLLADPLQAEAAAAVLGAGAYSSSSSMSPPPPMSLQDHLPESLLNQTSMDFFEYKPNSLEVFVGQMVELWPPVSHLRGCLFAAAPRLPLGVTLDERSGLVHGRPQDNEEPTQGQVNYFVTACNPARFPPTVSVALIKLTVNYATLAMLSLVDASRPCRSVYRPFINSIAWCSKSMGRHRPVHLQNDAGRRAVYLPGTAFLVVLATVLILRSGRAAPTWLLPSSRQTTEVTDVSASGYSRRSLLGSSLLSLISASPAMAESPCACCESDWCGCGAKCVDCHSYLSSRGYSLPADLASAVKSRGVSDWAAAVDWQTAEAPQWRPVRKEKVSAGQSLLPGAGRGLFARRALAKGAVLPPYKGQLQTFQTVTRISDADGPNMLQCGGAYVWCPQNPSDASAAFCMDAAADDPENPARLINAAANEEQCKQVNTEICQLGSILYFRTVQDVPAGTELVTDYGYSYWPDFDSCQLVTANDLMARLEKRSTR
eukprot:s1423_g8.t3